MNKRVEKLREKSVRTRPYISAERAELVTEFYRSDVPLGVSTAVCRAPTGARAGSVSSGAAPTVPALACVAVPQFPCPAKRGITRPQARNFAL